MRKLVGLAAVISIPAVGYAFWKDKIKKFWNDQIIEFFKSRSKRKFNKNSKPEDHMSGTSQEGLSTQGSTDAEAKDGDHNDQNARSNSPKLDNVSTRGPSHGKYSPSALQKQGAQASTLDLQEGQFEQLSIWGRIRRHIPKHGSPPDPGV
jgi:hypothetical protein